MASQSMMNRWSSVVAGKIKAGDVLLATPKQNKITDEERTLKNRVNNDLRSVQSYINKSKHAASNGHEFTLTIDDWMLLMNETVCAYSGRRLIDRSNDPDSRTMERVNPNLGYTKENTIAVCNAANSEKSLLDNFIKSNVITDAMKLKLLRKAAYQIEKKLSEKGKHDGI